MKSSLLARLSLVVLPIAAALSPIRPARAQSQSDWKAQDVAIGPDAKARVLWTNSGGSADLWTLSSSGTVEADYGKPYQSGWTTRAVSVGSDNRARLLSTNTDGRMTLEVVGPAGKLLARQTYGPYPGWTAADLACGHDNVTRVLWRNTNGQVSLWKVGNSNDLPLQTYVNHGPITGWTAQHISIDSQGKARLTWLNADGRLSFWVTTPALKLESSVRYGPFAGWTPFDLATIFKTGGNNSSRLAWKSTRGQLSLWTIDAKGNRQSTIEHGPFANYDARAIAVDTSGQTRVLWNESSGGADVWTTTVAGALASYDSYNYAPTNFQAKRQTNSSGANSGVALSWTTSPHASSYRIIRTRSGNGEFLTFTSSRPSFTDTTVEAGVTYYYRLSALTRHVESASTTASVDIPAKATGGSVNLAVEPAPSDDGTSSTNYQGPFIATDGTGTKQVEGTVTTYDLVATHPAPYYPGHLGQVRIQLSSSKPIQTGTQFVIEHDNASVSTYDYAGLSSYHSFASAVGPRTGTIAVTAVTGNSLSLRLTNVYLKGPAGQVTPYGDGDTATGAFFFNGTFVATNLKAPTPTPTPTPTATSAPTATPAPSLYAGSYAGPVNDQYNHATEYSVDFTVASDGTVSGGYGYRYRDQGGAPLTGTVVATTDVGAPSGHLMMRTANGVVFDGQISGTADSRGGGGTVSGASPGVTFSLSETVTGTGVVSTSNFVASNGTGTRTISASGTDSLELNAAEPADPGEYVRRMRVSLSKPSTIVVGDKFVVGTDKVSISIRQVESMLYYSEEVSTLNPDSSAVPGVVEVTALSASSISLRFSGIYMMAPPGSAPVGGGNGNVSSNRYILSGTFDANRVETTRS